MTEPNPTGRARLPKANESEIEFAAEGAELAAEKLLVMPPGTHYQHSAMHEYVDWRTVQYFGTHALPCALTCDPEFLARLT